MIDLWLPAGVALSLGNHESSAWEWLQRRSAAVRPFYRSPWDVTFGRRVSLYLLTSKNVSCGFHHTGTVCSLLREVRLEGKKPKATPWPSNGYVKKNLLRPTVGFHGRLRWGSAEFIKRAKNKNRARVFKKDSIYLLFSWGIKKYICIYQ